MAGTKRAMNAKGEVKRVKKGDLVAEHCAAVVSTIGDMPQEVLPETAKTMLASLADSSLKTPAAQRHKYQAQVVGMVGQAFQEFDQHLTRLSQEDRAKVDNVYADRAARQEALEKVQASMKDLEDAVVQKKEALHACSETLLAKKAELSAAAEAKAAADLTVAGTVKELEKVKAALQAMENLKSESSHSMAGKHGLRLVTDVGRFFNVDGCLLDSLANVVKKEPESRAGFDLVIVENIVEALAKLMEGFTAMVAAKEAPGAELAATTKAAEDIVAAADGAVRDAKEALHQAEQEVKAGAAAVKAAQKVLSSWLFDSKVVMDAYDNRVSELEGFRQGAAASFAMLKDLPEGGLKDPEEEHAAEGADAKAAECEQSLAEATAA